MTAVVVATCVAGVGVWLEPAAAAASQSSPITAAPGQRAPQPGASLLDSSSANASTTAVNFYNWSGYAATASTPFTEVQSTFVQPFVTCTAPGAWTVFWVGFDGFNNNTVEQAGTASECSSATNPQPTYYAWWEMYPTNTIQVMPITINTGDKVQATVTYSASNQTYALAVSDLTNKKQHYTKIATCDPSLVCARQSADWIVERPTVGGVLTPLADWGTMNLANDQAASGSSPNHHSAATQPVSAFTNTPIDMVNYPYTGEVLARAGSLDLSGTLFSDTWQATQ
jgi:hypothetical protein